MYETGGWRPVTGPATGKWRGNLALRSLRPPPARGGQYTWGHTNEDVTNTTTWELKSFDQAYRNCFPAHVFAIFESCKCSR